MITLRPEKMKPREISPLDLINIKDILGCLYYVYTKDVSVIVDRLEQKYSVDSSISEICEKKDTLTLHVEEGVYFKMNERIKVAAEIGSMRYSFTTTVFGVKDEGEIVIKLPAVINHDELRSLPRVLLPDAVCDCLELVTGIFSGVRMRGKIEDISLGGMSFAPDNIESLKNSNEIDLKDTKIKAGNRFRKMKLEINHNKLSIPVEICHTPTDERNTFGIKFDLSKKSKHSSKLREFIEACAPQIRVMNFASYYEQIKSQVDS